MFLFIFSFFSEPRTGCLFLKQSVQTYACYQTQGNHIDATTEVLFLCCTCYAVQVRGVANSYFPYSVWIYTHHQKKSPRMEGGVNLSCSSNAANEQHSPLHLVITFWGNSVDILQFDLLW